MNPSLREETGDTNGITGQVRELELPYKVSGESMEEFGVRELVPPLSLEERALGTEK